jgi:hypothetical protein
MLISLIIHIVQHIAHVDLNPALDPSNMTDAMVSQLAREVICLNSYDRNCNYYSSYLFELLLDLHVPAVIFTGHEAMPEESHFVAQR